MHFFAFMSGMERRALHFRAVSVESPERLLLGEEKPAEPIVFNRHSGSQPRDLMRETYARLRLVSDHLIETLQAHELTGWSTFPVRLRVNEDELTGYRGLAVTGRCGPIDRGRSEIVERLTRGGRGGVLYAELGLFVDPDTWDGADLFIPADSFVVCVTERAKIALEEARLTNVSFVPNQEYQLMLHANRPKRPGA